MIGRTEYRDSANFSLACIRRVAWSRPGFDLSLSLNLPATHCAPRRQGDGDRCAEKRGFQPVHAAASGAAISSGEYRKAYRESQLMLPTFQ